VFRESGFDPDNVIKADFFSEEFLSRYREQFDVVISRGFIEHFTDVSPVVQRHMELLKPDGHFIVVIPNLRGFNQLLAQMFDRGAIPRHNLQIMRKDAFANLFDCKQLEHLYCDYWGTFSFYLFTAEASSLRRSALIAGHRLQPILNFAFRTCFGDKGAESGLFSPYLIYVGRKRVLNG
jgi:SAM-dependent methyltransferase